MSLPHHEVAKALWASDLALLLNIEDHPATRVMSPIKFPEYLAAGLPIIISGASKEYMKIVEKEHIGFVIDFGSPNWKEKLFEFIDIVVNNRDEIKKRTTWLAKQNLSWQCMKKVIDSAF